MTGVTSPVGNLPTSFTSFVGRGREVAEIQHLLGTARLLTLTGVGGAGKTRLALEAAAPVGKTFPEGVFLVDLAPVRDAASVARTTAHALGLPDQSARPILEQLAGFVAGRRLLIVLDNCEHLVSACAEVATALMSAATELRVLATSRRTLDLAGEWVFTVPPLSPTEAAELLRDRTTVVNPDFRITETNQAQVARLCSDLDGLPLAIELAASRLRILSVEQVVQRLENRFTLLLGGNRGTLPRQRTLRAAIDWSHELCAPAERLLWSRLSVFAGDFALDAAEEVCAGDGISPDEVLDLLDRLVCQSIVTVTERDRVPRFRLLETIRQYGRERLAESGEEERLLRRNRRFFLSLAQGIAADWFGPGQEQALARLRAEHDNLLAVLEPPVGPSALSSHGTRTRPRGALVPSQAGSNDEETSDGQDRLALVGALRFHWCCNGFLGEGRRQFDRLLAALPAPTPARANALWAAAWVAVMQGDLDTVGRWLDEADALSEQLNNSLIHAYAQGVRGSAALYGGQPAEAAQLLENALTMQTALGEGPTTLQFHFQLALAQLYLGDPHAAETGRSAVTTAETHGERLCRSYALWALGYGAWLRGDAQESNTLMRTSLEIQRGFNDHAGVSGTLEVLAWSTAALGHHHQAARLLGALCPLTRDLNPTSAGPFAEPHAQCEQAIITAIGQTAYDTAFAQGCTYDSPARAITLALDSDTNLDQPTAAPAPSPLSDREREVAALVAKGLSNRQIASTLGRSTRTIDGHVQNILAKLSFGSRAQIAWWMANQVRGQ